jgi:hypothetical protein
MLRVPQDKKTRRYRDACRMNNGRGLPCPGQKAAETLKHVVPDPGLKDLAQGDNLWTMLGEQFGDEVAHRVDVPGGRDVGDTFGVVRENGDHFLKLTFFSFTSRKEKIMAEQGNDSLVNPLDPDSWSSSSGNTNDNDPDLDWNSWLSSSGNTNDNDPDNDPDHVVNNFAFPHLSDTEWDELIGTVHPVNDPDSWCTGQQPAMPPADVRHIFETTNGDEGTIIASNNGVNGAFNDGIIHQVCPNGETPGDKQRNAKALIEGYMREHPGDIAISSQPFQDGRLVPIKKNRTETVDLLQENELAVSLGNHGTRDEHWGHDEDENRTRLVYKNAHETPTIQHYELIGTVHPVHVGGEVQEANNFSGFENYDPNAYDDYTVAHVDNLASFFDL